jgi:hypothetical protein
VSQGIQGRGKTVPWATEEKEAGTVAAAKSWPPPLQADVQQAAVLIYGAAATDEAETLFCPSLSTCRLEEGEHRQTRGQRLVVTHGEDVFKSMDAECTCRHARKQGEAASRNVSCRRLVLRLAHFTHTDGEATCSRICLRRVGTYVCV